MAVTMASKSLFGWVSHAKNLLLPDRPKKPHFYQIFRSFAVLAGTSRTGRKVLQIISASRFTPNGSAITFTSRLLDSNFLHIRINLTSRIHPAVNRS
jgi:hypothetical protein